jgi:hypothetical protein
MLTERLRAVIAEAEKLSEDEQEALAAAIHVLLQQPQVTSEVVRPHVMEAFEQVMGQSGNVLEYLRDK